MKARLWWADDQDTDENPMPLADLIAWFKETAQTFKSTTSAGKPAPGVPPQPPEIYWHGKNGRACPCSGCCAGGAVLLDDPTTQALTRGGKRRLSA